MLSPSPFNMHRSVWSSPCPLDDIINRCDIDVLENASIAWPNTSMWNRPSLMSNMPVPAYASDEGDSHAHSPRRRPPAQQEHHSVDLTKHAENAEVKATWDCGASRHQTTEQLHSYMNITGFVDSLAGSDTYLKWLNSVNLSAEESCRLGVQNPPVQSRVGRKANTDVSMSDYGSSHHDDHAPIASDPQFAILGNQPEEDSLLSQLNPPFDSPIRDALSAGFSEGMSSCLSLASKGAYILQ